MNRLQKKCLIVAAGFHLLLLTILFVGPAFLSPKSKSDDLPVLDCIPTKIIDAAFYGGGNPKAQPPPPVHQEITPPQPQPQPQPQPVVKSAPLEKPETKETEKNPFADKPRKLNVSTTIVKQTPNKIPAKDDSDTKARERAAKIAAALRSAARGLRENLSSSTVVDISGPGGEAYANYAQVVKSVYTQAWIAPDEIADDQATVKARVTIARDGTVTSARITGESGSTPLDRSIQRTLDRVQFVAPFPEGSKDQERSFNINFNLKAKRLAG